jgi:Holliday junction resolvasome RuvABC endonuclease subunit
MEMDDVPGAVAWPWLSDTEPARPLAHSKDSGPQNATPHATNAPGIAVGVDSAELTGIVAINRARIIYRESCTVSGWNDVERVADTVADLRPVVVAIEAPFVRLNTATGLTLARLIGRWLQAFERRGTSTTAVLASTWQPIVLAGRMTTTTPGPARKLAAIAWALETFGIELPGDEADAAGIAAWAQHQLWSPASPLPALSNRLDRTRQRAAASPNTRTEKPSPIHGDPMPTIAPSQSLPSSSPDASKGVT